MQVLIQVVSTKDDSLRKRIANDTKLKEFGLSIRKKKQVGRSPGWLKLHSSYSDRHGAINVEWSESSRILTYRVVTKRAGKPFHIVGDFIAYMLGRFRTRIGAITIIPG